MTSGDGNFTSTVFKKTLRYIGDTNILYTVYNELENYRVILNGKCLKNNKIKRANEGQSLPRIKYNSLNRLVTKIRFDSFFELFPTENTLLRKIQTDHEDSLGRFFETYIQYTNRRFYFIFTK